MTKNNIEIQKSGGSYILPPFLVYKIVIKKGRGQSETSSTISRTPILPTV